MIQPQPAPAEVNIGIVAKAQAPDGKAKVIIQINDITGQKVTFLPPEAAKQLGERLMDAATQADSGLITAMSAEVQSFLQKQQ